METKGKMLVTLNVDLNPDVLKKVIKEGRVSEFVNLFPSLVAGQIKGLIVEQIASGKFGKFVMEFDDEYGNGGPWPGPGPRPFMDTLPVSMLRQQVKA